MYDINSTASLVTLATPFLYGMYEASFVSWSIKILIESIMLRKDSLNRMVNFEQWFHTSSSPFSWR